MKNKSIQILHSLFEASFLEAYNKADKSTRNLAMPYLQSMYRRWFYAAIIEDSPMSPANLLDSICRHENLSTSLAPVAVPKEKTKLTGIEINFLEYSLDNHPVVEDLRILLDMCSPHIDLSEHETLFPDKAKEISDKQSLRDIQYTRFLMEIAVRLRLLKKIPSVGIVRYKTDYTVLDNLSPIDLLHDIVEAALQLASRALQCLPMLPEGLFSVSYLRSLL